MPDAGRHNSSTRHPFNIRAKGDYEVTQIQKTLLIVGGAAISILVCVLGIYLWNNHNQEQEADAIQGAAILAEAQNIDESLQLHSRIISEYPSTEAAKQSRTHFLRLTELNRKNKKEDAAKLKREEEIHAAEEAAAAKQAELDAANTKAEQEKKALAIKVQDEIEIFAQEHHNDHQAEKSLYRWIHNGYEVVDKRQTQQHGAVLQVTIRTRSRAVGIFNSNNVYGYPTATFELYFNETGQITNWNRISETK